MKQARAKIAAKPKHQPFKKIVLNAAWFAGSDLLDRLESKAREGDDLSLRDLIMISNYAAAKVEAFLTSEARRVEALVHKWGQLGINEEIAILWSWKNHDTERRVQAVKKLRLGSSLPDRPDIRRPSRDPFTHRIRETFLPVICFEPNFRGWPRKPTPQICRLWAKKIADKFYPRGQPRPINEIDAKAVKFESRRRKRRDRESAKSNSLRNLGTEASGWRARSTSAADYGMFRSSFIDCVASRLGSIFRVK
jgi:hypothetical protein